MRYALAPRIFEAIELDGRIHAAIDSAAHGDWRSRLDAIRSAYRLAGAAIAAGSYDPYIVPVTMTPIERGVWHDIRRFSLPFYPQYPVGRFVADFADPAEKIAIECDGRQFHDVDRDRLRDEEMERAGWRVIRIEGWRCLLDEDDPEGSTPIVRHLAASVYGKPEPFL